MALKRSSLENYTLLLVELKKMRHTNFNAKTFLKKINQYIIYITGVKMSDLIITTLIFTIEKLVIILANNISMIYN